MGRRFHESPLEYILHIFFLVALALIVAYPLVSLLTGTVAGTSGVDLRQYAYILSEPYYQKVLLNTLLLGGTVALLGTVMAFVAAYAMVRTPLPGKSLLHAVFLLPTITPPFLFAMSFIMLFGRRGLITYHLLGLNTTSIYGYTGLTLALSLTFFPFAYLILRGLLERLDPSLEEAALTMGATPWTILRTVTLPLLKPGLGSAFLLLFLDTIADLGNPLILGGNFGVLASEIYMAVIGRYNIGQGASLGVILLVPAVLLFLVQRSWATRAAFATLSGRTSMRTLELTGRGTTGALFAWSSLLALFIFSLYGVIFAAGLTRLWGVNFTFTWDHITYALTRHWSDIRTTLLLATVAAVGTGIAGVVIAFLVQRRNLMGRTVMDVLATMSLAIPGTVLGLAYAIAFSRPPIFLAGTALIILLLFAIRTIPYGIRFAVTALQQIDKSVDEASLTLGAGTGYTFRRILLPLLQPALFSGIVYNFTRNVITLSAVIFVVSPRWNLVTAAILAHADAGGLGRAAALGSLLIVVVVSILGLTSWLFSRRGVRVL